MDRNEAAQQLREAVAQVIEAARSCGNVNEAAEQIVNAITQEHRTHQQMFMGALKLAVYKYASVHHDLRNEAAVEWSEQVKTLPNSDLLFPYI